MEWRDSVWDPQRKIQMLQGVGPNNRDRKDIRYSIILPTKKIYL